MDVVVTVPKGLWEDWLDEGDLPGEPWSGMRSHFWLRGALPEMSPGERVYIVAHNRLRGYAPLVQIERRCSMRPSVSCLMRYGDAVAVTIPETIRGFQGFRYRWWDRLAERPFPQWQEAQP
jgi:hypothetical protein